MHIQRTAQALKVARAVITSVLDSQLFAITRFETAFSKSVLWSVVHISLRFFVDVKAFIIRNYTALPLLLPSQIARLSQKTAWRLFISELWCTTIKLLMSSVPSISLLSGSLLECKVCERESVWFPHMRRYPSPDTVSVKVSNGAWDMHEHAGEVEAT